MKTLREYINLIDEAGHRKLDKLKQELNSLNSQGILMHNLQAIENHYIQNKRRHPEIGIDDSIPEIDYICPHCKTLTPDHYATDPCPECGEESDLEDACLQIWD